jgi:hypothetical protein
LLRYRGQSATTGYEGKRRGRKWQPFGFRVRACYRAFLRAPGPGGGAILGFVPWRARQTSSEKKPKRSDSRVRSGNRKMTSTASTAAKKTTITGTANAISTFPSYLHCEPVQGTSGRSGGRIFAHTEAASASVVYAGWANVHRTPAPPWQNQRSIPSTGSAPAKEPTGAS